jgi:hypothetical protein
MTTRKQRTILLAELAEAPEPELRKLARIYVRYRRTPKEERNNLLEQIETASESRAQLIRKIHAAEGKFLELNKRFYEQMVGHNGQQPATGYFLATALRINSINPEDYERLE